MPDENVFKPIGWRVWPWLPMPGRAYMSSPDEATWRSGYATVCKTVYTSSILVVASINIIRLLCRVCWENASAVARRVLNAEAAPGMGFQRPSRLAARNRPPRIHALGGGSLPGFFAGDISFKSRPSQSPGCDGHFFANAGGQSPQPRIVGTHPAISRRRTSSRETEAAARPSHCR